VLLTISTADAFARAADEEKKGLKEILSRTLDLGTDSLRELGWSFLVGAASKETAAIVEAAKPIVDKIADAVIHKHTEPLVDRLTDQIEKTLKRSLDPVFTPPDIRQDVEKAIVTMRKRLVDEANRKIASADLSLQLGGMRDLIENDIETAEYLASLASESPSGMQSTASFSTNLRDIDAAASDARRSIHNARERFTQEKPKAREFVRPRVEFAR
jgi:hypothetical protein